MTETAGQAKSSKISTNNNLVIYLYPLLHNQLICMAYIPAWLRYSPYGWFSDTCVWGTYGNVMFHSLPMGKSPDPGQKCLPDKDDLAQLTLTAPSTCGDVLGRSKAWVGVCRSIVMQVAPCSQGANSMGLSPENHLLFFFSFFFIHKNIKCLNGNHHLLTTFTKQISGRQHNNILCRPENHIFIHKNTEASSL